MYFRNGLKIDRWPTPRLPQTTQHQNQICRLFDMINCNLLKFPFPVARVQRQIRCIELSSLLVKICNFQVKRRKSFFKTRKLRELLPAKSRENRKSRKFDLCHSMTHNLQQLNLI